MAPLFSEERVTIKKESRLLFQKAINSLILSVEHFNRPSERGRTEAVLIFLDHAFEMLLKASILFKSGVIREKGVHQTIGFDACVRKAYSDANLKFLDKDQVLTLQMLNSVRDAAQHHLIDLSEDQLYFHAQSGLTLFRDLLSQVFRRKLSDFMPQRILPVSVRPPTDLAALFDSEVKDIQKILGPKRRKGTEAGARIKALAIVDGAIQGQKLQPSVGDIRKLVKEVKGGKSWDKIFPGVAALEMTSDGVGPSLDLRITKRGGVPVQLVPEGTPGAGTIAIKRVNELGFYSLGRDQLAKCVGQSGPKTTSLVWHAKIKEDSDCYKQIKVGRSTFDRYSSKAIEKILYTLRSISAEEVWEIYKKRNGAKK